MKDLIGKVVLSMVLKRLSWNGESAAAAAGTYAGYDVKKRSLFSGIQGQLNLKGGPGRVVTSIEGNPASGTERWQINADAMHVFGRESAKVTPYVGAGACVVGQEDGKGKRPGLNLFGGSRVRLGDMHFFVQMRFTFADGAHFSIAGGLRPTL
ncbi:hypothetical protein CRI94_12735 [Longibacter salinarum]|uniref:Outer membrane protein beta-barrel domain-containing protein n=1 Tax=Longibacter salinarum TaxID=1850348 RepID=A0A2A8CW96_9BACT|nr:hypothetical protein [Longibacter salinarum]PEN12864.1 hypothetical protein CRI94_12735 [Longibacter salinarum]